MIGRLRSTLALSCAFSLFLTTQAAHAQQRSGDPCVRSVCEDRSSGYWITHSLLVGGLGLGALITGNTWESSPPHVRAVAPESRALAKAMLTLELVLPAPMLLNSFRQSESFDAFKTYGEVLLSATVVDNVLRPAGLDGSTTLAFSAAVSSAYLFDQSQFVDVRMRGAFWGVQLGLATANATLNGRAGQHDLDDAFVGAGLGIGLGVLWQAANAGWRVRALEPTPISLLRFESVDRLNDVRDHVWLLTGVGMWAGYWLSMLAPEAIHDPNLDYQVVPMAIGPGGAGVGVLGEF